MEVELLIPCCLLPFFFFSLNVEELIEHIRNRRKFDAAEIRMN